TSYEFLRQAGVPGCCDLLKIEAAQDPNQIGTDVLSGNILMSQLDVDSLGALLGTGSQLIMRCESPKCIAKPVSSPVAVNSPGIGAVGNQANISSTSAPASSHGLSLNAEGQSQSGIQEGVSEIQAAPGLESGGLDSLPSSLDELPASLDELPGTLPSAGAESFDTMSELPDSL
ncbi:MAG: hypothetical protein Q4D17_06600, partial [Planctomycetia bacterium]|nr:hypothetical protein [Planctomycetia bacterium]